jgi:hypothetical protein
MLQLENEASNTQISSVDSLLPIDSAKEDEAENSQFEVVEEDETEVEDPALIQTKHDFVTSPWSRLGIIGGAFGAGFLVIFVVLNGMMNGGGKNAKKPEVNPTPTPTVAASETKEGDVYAKLALAKQQEELDALNGKANTGDKEEKKEATEEEQAKNPEKTRSIRQRRVAAQETPPTSRRRVYRKETPEPVRPTRRVVASQPIPPLRPSTPLPKFAKQTVASNQSVAKDPIAELERLRNLGSVGRVEYMLASTTINEPTNTTVPEVTAKTEETLRPAEQNSDRSRRRRNRGSENTETVTNTPNQVEELRPRWQPLKTVESSVTSNKGNYLPEEAQILNKTQPQYLVVGSFASATLVTPLVMPQTSNNARSQEQTNTLRFVARLNEPLYSNTGEIAIPAGTLLTIAMISVDSTSGVRAEVAAILKDGTEYPLSPGTISVLGEAGAPLIARPYDDKGSEIAKYDATLGTIAGLAKVGEIINQPDEEVTEDLPLGGTRTRSRNNNRNLGAAFLEGAFGKLGETISKRTERATDEINRRPNVWYVPKDTKITIKVDRSIKL